jgi:flavin-dependent dehydrogenase
VIPREKRVVNVGLGVHLGLRRPPRLRKFFGEVLDNYPIFRGSKVIKAGGWRIPLRRPIDTCVWNGLLLVGDAGSHVKPTDGEGIGFSMQAGVMAGKAIIRAHDLGSFSRDSLWYYNVHIMKVIGGFNGPLELGKRKILNLTSKQVQDLFDSGILDAEELYQLNSGNGLNFRKIEMLKKLWKGKKVLSFLFSLRKTIKDMRKAKKIYLEYPESFDGFLQWKKKIERLYD